MTYLIVNTAFLQYVIGQKITDPSIIASLRASEYADYVRLVADDASPPGVPPSPPPSAEYTALKAMIDGLGATVTAQTTAINGLTGQIASLLAIATAQQDKLAQQNTSIAVLSARVAGQPISGSPPGDPSDDVGLRAINGAVLVGADGTTLGGSKR